MMFKTSKIVVVQWQRSKAQGSVTLQEYPGFHIYFDIVLLFFDFLITGGTYDNQTWTKMFRKNFLCPQCYFSEVKQVMTRTGKLYFDCLFVGLDLHHPGTLDLSRPDWVAPALLGFPVTLNNINMVIQKAKLFFVLTFRAH